MGELRDRMEADLRLRNLRPNTQAAYLTTAKALAAWHGRSPTLLGAEDVRAFLVHLQSERQIAGIDARRVSRRAAVPVLRDAGPA